MLPVIIYQVNEQPAVKWDMEDFGPANSATIMCIRQIIIGTDIVYREMVVWCRAGIELWGNYSIQYGPVESVRS